jgi:hypothetical protein
MTNDENSLRAQQMSATIAFFITSSFKTIQSEGVAGVERSEPPVSTVWGLPTVDPSHPESVLKLLVVRHSLIRH